jgi:hypothetical protein
MKHSPLHLYGSSLSPNEPKTTVYFNGDGLGSHPLRAELLSCRSIIAEQFWTRICQRQTTAVDLEKLHNRVFGSLNGPDTDDPKWEIALFVTLRNVVRRAWNHQSVVRHLATTEKQVFISPAPDTGVPPQYRDGVIWEIDANTGKLATWTLLCVDGPVVVTSTKIAVELGIANRTRAIVKEVVPHPLDETGWYQASRLVVLSRPPICVWIQPVTQNNGRDDITSSEYSFHEGNKDGRN